MCLCASCPPLLIELQKIHKHTVLWLCLIQLIMLIGSVSLCVSVAVHIRARVRLCHLFFQIQS